MTKAEKLKRILADGGLFIETFIKIIDKHGRLVHFRLNPEQKELLKGMDKYNIVLKSRQLGISTLAMAYSLYIAITQHDSHCMLVSYSQDSADAIFDKLKQMYNDLPQCVKPKDISNNRKQIKFENGSKITVNTLGTKDIARGSTLAFVHISELAFAKQDVVEKQLLAIEQALRPDGKLIIESTANGLNYFSELYDKAESQENLYKAFFFSWVQDRFMFASEYKDFAKRYEKTHKKLTAKDLTADEKTLAEQGATIEQLEWRRMKIANSSESEFKQEFPANSLEAFQTTGNNTFDPVKIEKYFDIANKRERLIEIATLPQPLKPYVRNYLSIWQTPKKGDRYYIGVDASEGLGQDYNVIEVLNADGVQCAEFRTNKIQPYVIAEICYQMALYYNRALMVIEKASGGHLILEKMVHEYHYRNLLKHKDYDQRGRMVKKVGWVTSSKTKGIMINDFVEWFENGDLHLFSRDLLKEMRTYVFDGSSFNAQAGKHDDTVMALAMAIQGIKSGVNYI